jgi:hypothetical protein
MCIPATPAEGRGAAPAFPVGQRSARAGTRFLGIGEPPLAELMADEVVRRLMARDGVGAEQLLSLIDEVRSRLG